MKNYKITLLRGDGIGPEIVAEALKVMDAAGERFGYKMAYTDALMGGCAIDVTGVPLPQETIDSCLSSDAVLLGAVGDTSGTPCRAICARRRACWASVPR